jgi:SET domain-containing protein
LSHKNLTAEYNRGYGTEGTVARLRGVDTHSKVSAMILVPTYVGPSEIEGVGVFAAAPIPKGTQIWLLDEAFDRVLTEEEIEALRDDCEKQAKAFDEKAAAEREKAKKLTHAKAARKK